MRALIQEAEINMKFKTTVEQGPLGLRIMPKRKEKKNKKGLPEAIKCKLCARPFPRVPQVFTLHPSPAHHKVQNIF